MKEKIPHLVCLLAVILLLAVSGCVAPPKETPSTPVDLYDPNQFATNNGSSSSPSGFVSEVTIAGFGPSTPSPAGYTTFAAATPIPSDITCLIYSKSAAYAYNGSAFVFDQKNPPMYINYTVKPQNVTRNEVYTNRFGQYKDTKGDTYTASFSDYSPYSWFEVTVRDNTTKEIILQDGFGATKGYSTYLSRTLKVLKTGDLLVELRGNEIKAGVSIWVKPQGNFDESRLSEFTNCMYWDEHRDTVATAKATTIKGVQYTWTPENKNKGSGTSGMVTQGAEPIRNVSNDQWG